ncbi:MAG: MerR family transcriptional regulator [Bacteroidetes bacterium]|nr:MerR family transcriptional regulator [Bacteroidota bacterium]MCL5739236.1 MerR family transcriptional regulator [Bacteroidota bacterium]
MKDFEFKKLYYSISEVSRITTLEQHVLRYWESQFPELNPAKNRAGNRIYTNKDISLIFEIKRLVREEGFTIEGAKKVLSAKSNGNPAQLVETEGEGDTTQDLKQTLLETRAFLEELIQKLSVKD